MSSKQNKNRPIKAFRQTAECRECGRLLTSPRTVARRLCRSCFRVWKVVAADATR